jgi:hypothetical protein
MVIKIVLFTLFFSIVSCQHQEKQTSSVEMDEGTDVDLAKLVLYPDDHVTQRGQAPLWHLCATLYRGKILRYGKMLLNLQRNQIRMQMSRQRRKKSSTGIYRVSLGLMSTQQNRLSPP